MKKYEISKYEIKSKKIDKDLKILFLSDLHNKNFKNELIKILDSENPNFIVLGGDMINESLKETKNFIDLFSCLNNYEVYYIYGNHEEELSLDDYNKYKELIENSNVKLLKNDDINLTDNIKLIGLVSEKDKYQNFKLQCIDKNYIEGKIKKVDNEKFNILVSHNPLEFNSYVDYNCDLVLSGHIHGGVIRLPFIGPLFSPNVTLFPKYSQGMYKKNNTSMIVSRGIGNSKRLPIRINNKPEIVIIKLIKE